MPAFEQLRALIVEDNMHMCRLLKQLIGALGIKESYEAANGVAGFAILREHQPDLILTDLTMQPMDGIEFTKKVRLSEESPNPYVPIIMVTGHTERHRVEAARDAGVTEFLAKPVTVNNLFLRIAEIVERPRPYVRCAGYFGPDRRRRDDANYLGPWRRQTDAQNDLVLR